MAGTKREEGDPLMDPSMIYMLLCLRQLGIAALSEHENSQSTCLGK